MQLLQLQQCSEKPEDINCATHEEDKDGEADEDENKDMEAENSIFHLILILTVHCIWKS